MTTATKFLSAIGPTSSDGPTCGRQMDITSAKSMLWAAGSRVLTYQLPGTERAWYLASHLVYGRSLPVLLAIFNPASFSWKTSQLCFQGMELPYSATLPDWGMMRDGELYPLTTPEPIIFGNDYGLWPTPSHSDDDVRTSLNPHLTKNGTVRHINKQGTQSATRLSQVALYWEGNSELVLNPQWVCQLMGFPLDWLQLPDRDNRNYHTNRRAKPRKQVAQTGGMNYRHLVTRSSRRWSTLSPSPFESGWRRKLRDSRPSRPSGDRRSVEKTKIE